MDTFHDKWYHHDRIYLKEEADMEKRILAFDFRCFQRPGNAQPF